MQSSQGQSRVTTPASSSSNERFPYSKWCSLLLCLQKALQSCLLCVTAAAVFTGCEGGWCKGSHRTRQETSYVGFAPEVMHHSFRSSAVLNGCWLLARHRNSPELQCYVQVSPLVTTDHCLLNTHKENSSVIPFISCFPSLNIQVDFVTVLLLQLLRWCWDKCWNQKVLLQSRSERSPGRWRNICISVHY